MEDGEDAEGKGGEDEEKKEEEESEVVEGPGPVVVGDLKELCRVRLRFYWFVVEWRRRRRRKGEFGEERMGRRRGRVVEGYGFVGFVYAPHYTDDYRKQSRCVYDSI